MSATCLLHIPCDYSRLEHKVCAVCQEAYDRRQIQPDANLVKLAAECHRAKWEFDFSEEDPPTRAALHELVKNAFRTLARIGDMALMMRDTLAYALNDGAASQGAFAGSDITSDERDISGRSENQRSEPGKAGVDGSIPSRSTISNISLSEERVVAQEMIDELAQVIDYRAYFEWGVYRDQMIADGKDEEAAAKMADYHWLNDKKIARFKARQILDRLKMTVSGRSM